MESKEVVAEIEDGVQFKFMTFGGQVPGPMIRVRQGDTIILTHKNASTIHSLDFHTVYDTQRTLIMKSIKHLLLPILMSLPLLLHAQTAMAEGTEAEVKVIEIIGTDQMRFTVTQIVARPGQKIKVLLTTVSDYPKMAMAHNFILLKAKADATAVTNAAVRASKNGYIPEDKEGGFPSRSGRPRRTFFLCSEL